MLMFVQWGQMPAWVLAVVIAREFAISGLRMMAATDGKVIAAAWSGKVKTAATMVCIILMFLPIPAVLNTICWLVILVTTVYSGVEYFLKNKTVIDWTNL
jgi:CDP-diacylglycerol--glycerol-3-phosphate 3-phosphatidyltransferase